MPPLTPKRLRGLQHLLSYLDIVQASGWEGTPFDSHQPHIATIKQERGELEAAIQWLASFASAKEINRQAEQPARPRIPRESSYGNHQAQDGELRLFIPPSHPDH